MPRASLHHGPRAATPARGNDARRNAAAPQDDRGATRSWDWPARDGDGRDLRAGRADGAGADLLTLLSIIAAVMLIILSVWLA